MSDPEFPVALQAEELPPRRRRSSYPEPFATRMKGRHKRVLGERFGLSNFGVNLTRLDPGARSALRHSHSHQDELIYILEGHPTLITDAGSTPLSPGMCAGFAAGRGDAHHLINRSHAPVLYLEIGDRSPEDRVEYPDDDLAAELGEEGWHFTHKDGRPY